MGLFNFGAPIPDDDTFDGAKEEFKTPVQMQREAGAANEVKEKRRSRWNFAGAGFDADGEAEQAESEDYQSYVPHQDAESAATPSIFGNFKRPARQHTDDRTKANAATNNILVFSPMNLDEMRGLKTYLQTGTTVFLRLDRLPEGLDRRMLDFASGMAYALNGKISEFSGKTYVVSANNVEIVDETEKTGKNKVEADENRF